ncbi:hypothetical protein FAGKG844_240042 [Frankia sp. AgKG'84/4]
MSSSADCAHVVRWSGDRSRSPEEREGPGSDPARPAARLVGLRGWWGARLVGLAAAAGGRRFGRGLAEPWRERAEAAGRRGRSRSRAAAEPDRTRGSREGSVSLSRPVANLYPYGPLLLRSQRLFMLRPVRVVGVVELVAGQSG